MEYCSNNYAKKTNDEIIVYMCCKVISPEKQFYIKWLNGIFFPPVSKYEVLMKESEAGRLTEERSNLLFQILDNLLPQLGVFRPIVSKLRNELYGTLSSCQSLRMFGFLLWF